MSRAVLLAVLACPTSALLLAQPSTLHEAPAPASRSVKVPKVAALPRKLPTVTVKFKKEDLKDVCETSRSNGMSITQLCHANGLLSHQRRSHLIQEFYGHSPLRSTY